MEDEYRINDEKKDSVNSIPVILNDLYPKEVQNLLRSTFAEDMIKNEFQRQLEKLNRKPATYSKNIRCICTCVRAHDSIGTARDALEDLVNLDLSGVLSESESDELEDAAATIIRCMAEADDRIMSEVSSFDAYKKDEDAEKEEEEDETDLADHYCGNPEKGIPSKHERMKNNASVRRVCKSEEKEE